MSEVSLVPCIITAAEEEMVRYRSMPDHFLLCCEKDTSSSSKLILLTEFESLNSRPRSATTGSSTSHTAKPTMTSELHSTVNLSPHDRGNTSTLLFTIYVLCTAFGGLITGLSVVFVVSLVNHKKKRKHKQHPLKSKNVSNEVTIRADPIYETVAGGGSANECKNERFISLYADTDRHIHSE